MSDEKVLSLTGLTRYNEGLKRKLDEKYGGGTNPCVIFGVYKITGYPSIPEDTETEIFVEDVSFMVNGKSYVGMRFYRADGQLSYLCDDGSYDIVFSMGDEYEGEGYNPIDFGSVSQSISPRLMAFIQQNYIPVELSDRINDASHNSDMISGVYKIMKYPDAIDSFEEDVSFVANGISYVGIRFYYGDGALVYKRQDGGDDTMFSMGEEYDGCYNPINFGYDPKIVSPRFAAFIQQNYISYNITEYIDKVLIGGEW